MDLNCCKCNCTSMGTSLDLEQKFYDTSLRLWHVLFMGFASFMAIVVCICCCVRFRIPRTKQEIEADYVRKKITRKFQKQLQLIQNSEMDDMDLKKALEKVLAEFMADQNNEESHSNNSNDNDDSVFRGEGLGVSNDDLVQKPKRGFGSRVASFVGFLRPRKTPNNSPQKSTKNRV